MSKIDTSTLERHSGSTYPKPLDQKVAGRSYLRLGDAGGLTQFGVNLVRLEPGAMSSLRHWQLQEDEFVMVTSGDLVLVMDEGETPMTVGDCAAFKAGVPNGHCLINRTDSPAEFLVIGTRSEGEVVTYSDVDMKVTVTDKGGVFTRRDGSPLNMAEGENS